ncbi:MAG: PPOX class F420-dependent oxidoreductase, partial [Dehalococcoidia bacterium]
MFTEAEKAYLQGQRLARIATVSADLQPDVAPVGFKFDEGRFYVGGYDLQRTRKYKNVLQNARVSLVVDDLVAVEPWTPRGIRIHGQAD